MQRPIILSNNTVTVQRLVLCDNGTAILQQLKVASEIHLSCEAVALLHESLPLPLEFTENGTTVTVHWEPLLEPCHGN